MKKVLFLGSVSYKRNRLDGVTVKSRMLLQWLKNKEIELNVLDTDNWIKRSGSILFSLFKYMKSSEVIILSSADRGAYYALKLLKLLGIKKTVYYFVAGGRLAERIENGQYSKDVYSNCKKIYVESKEMNTKLLKLGLESSEIMDNFRFVPNNIEVKKPENEVKCIYFGRVIEEKGITEAVEVVSDLVNEGVEISFDIYGQISDEYYEKLKPKLSEKVKYCGVMDYGNEQEKYELLSQYDVLLFPTKYPGECLPGTLIESYIAGLAVIASDWKYAREYIEDEKTGYIFEYKSLEDFKEKLYKLVMDKERIFEFKLASLEKSKQYDCDKILEVFYKELK